MSIENKLQQIRDEIASCTVMGFYAFGQEGPYTDTMIDPEKLHKIKHRKELLDHAAEVILQTPTAGVVGVRHVMRRQWIVLLANALRRQGAHELPVSELWRNFPITISGPYLHQYPSGSPVTALGFINTLGEEIGYVKKVVENKFGLRVMNAVSLIDRNPELSQEVAGVPYSTVLHIPLPLYHTEYPARQYAARPGGYYGSWTEANLEPVPLMG